MSRLRSAVLLTATSLALLGCGGSGEKTGDVVETSATSATPATSATSVATPTAPTVLSTSGTGAPTTSATPSQSTTSTTSSAVTAVETSTTSIPATVDPVQDPLGSTTIDLTVGGGDAGRPVFSWVAAGATRFELVVQSVDGAPLWAWTGSATTVVLGGVERPPAAEGPTLLGPSRARVFAFDSAHALLAASSWVPAGPPAA